MFVEWRVKSCQFNEEAWNSVNIKSSLTWTKMNEFSSVDPNFFFFLCVASLNDFIVLIFAILATSKNASMYSRHEIVIQFKWSNLRRRGPLKCFCGWIRKLIFDVYKFFFFSSQSSFGNFWAVRLCYAASRRSNDEICQCQALSCLLMQIIFLRRSLELR